MRPGYLLMLEQHSGHASTTHQDASTAHDDGDSLVERVGLGGFEPGSDVMQRASIEEQSNVLDA